LVPDLPINRSLNLNVDLPPISGVTTQTNGILITSKYSNRASGSITPVEEANDDDSLLPARRVGTKHVRFTAIASSDEDERKSTKQKYGFNDQVKKQATPAIAAGIDPEAIVLEPRRKRLRLSLDDEEELEPVPTTRAQRIVSRSNSVESSNS
jgi:hypothetical protein